MKDKIIAAIEVYKTAYQYCLDHPLSWYGYLEDRYLNRGLCFYFENNGIWSFELNWIEKYMKHRYKYIDKVPDHAEDNEEAAGFLKSRIDILEKELELLNQIP